MIQDLTPQEAIKRLEQHFGGREGMMLHQLTMLSTSGQPADITFYRRKPILDVRISTKLSAARLYAKRKKLGPFATRARDPQKDMAALARAGFSYDVVSRVIKNNPADFEN